MDHTRRRNGGGPAREPRAPAGLQSPGPLGGFVTVGCRLIAYSLSLLILGTFGGCATVPLDGADRAQLADVATTGVGVSAGLVEGNPIMAPLTGGPVGLAAMAGIKLGLNRIGRRQEPATCRQWLCVSTAAGWGAASSNLAMLVAPPLALAAVPAAIGSYQAAWRGSALETCYEGRLSDAILRVPENTGLDQMPVAQRRELMQIAGWWPDPDMMPGTRPVDGYMLVHLLLIDDAASLEQLIVRRDLDWTVVGVQDREGNDILALDLAVLAAHMLPPAEAEPARQSDKQLVSAADIAGGAVTVPKYRGMVWRIAETSPTVPEQLPGEIQQALAEAP